MKPSRLSKVNQNTTNHFAMLHQDNISEAMEIFLKQLPDPNLSTVPSIETEIQVKGKRVKFRAQKAKSLLGMTWKVDSEGGVN